MIWYCTVHWSVSAFNPLLLCGGSVARLLGIVVGLRVVLCTGAKSTV